MLNMIPTFGSPNGTLSSQDLQLLENAAPVFKKIFPSALNNEEEYDRAIEIMDALIAITGGDEEHYLTPFVHALASLIHDYQEKYPFVENAEPKEILAFLMEQHGIKQTELPEVGSQGVVSEILNGKRQLNRRQIEALSTRFKVSPSVFFPKPKLVN